MKKGAVTLDEPGRKGADRRSAGVREGSHSVGPEAAVHHQNPSRQSSGHAAPALPNLKRSGKADGKKRDDGMRTKCFASAPHGCINATLDNSAGRVSAE